MSREYALLVGLLVPLCIAAVSYVSSFVNGWLSLLPLAGF